MTEKMDFAGGKYTVINDNGKLTALRYGEPWGRDEDLVGDNLVHSMLVDSLRLKAQRDALLAALRKAVEDGCANSYAHEDDVCGERGCCGVVSYAPHTDDCWVTTARAAIKAVEEN